ncbi:hypothetical protein BaRGS_00025810, partial [Batillaria attramentaria]
MSVKDALPSTASRYRSRAPPVVRVPPCTHHVTGAFFSLGVDHGKTSHPLNHLALCLTAQRETGQPVGTRVH